MSANFKPGDVVTVNVAYAQELLVKIAKLPTLQGTVFILGYLTGGPSVVQSQGSVLVHDDVYGSMLQHFIRLTPLDILNPVYNQGQGASIYFLEKDQINQIFNIATTFAAMSMPLVPPLEQVLLWQDTLSIPHPIGTWCVKSDDDSDVRKKAGIIRCLMEISCSQVVKLQMSVSSQITEQYRTKLAKKLLVDPICVTYARFSHNPTFYIPGSLQSIPLGKFGITNGHHRFTAMEACGIQIQPMWVAFSSLRDPSLNATYQELWQEQH